MKIEASIRIAYFIMFLKEKPDDLTPAEAAGRIKRNLNNADHHDLLISCQRPKVLKIFDNNGIHAAAAVAAMYLPYSCQESLMELY